MLTQHQKPSRRTTRNGLAGIAALAVAGLALTASGTRAAENLKAKVEDRMGVSIDAIEMPELSALPLMAAPPEPVVAPTPPDVPQGEVTRIYRSRDGKRTIIIDRDTVTTTSGETDARRIAAEAARIHVPEVRSERCGGEGPVSLTVRGADGSATSTTICTDRLERQVAIGHEARSEGLRAAAYARAEAYRDAEAARAEGRRARMEALREAGAARTLALREAERGRAEGLREASIARALAQREAEHARAEGRREAERGRAEGLREAEQARAEARRQASEARAEVLRAAREVRAETARARAYAFED